MSRDRIRDTAREIVSDPRAQEAAKKGFRRLMDAFAKRNPKGLVARFRRIFRG